MHSNQLRHSLLSIFSWLFFFFNLFNSTPFFRKSIEKFCAMSYVFIFSPLDLEQCSLKVLEPEGSPSWSLLKLLGDRGCTVVELVEFLQAMEHTEALQCLSYSGQFWFVLVFPLQPCFLH